MRQQGEKTEVARMKWTQLERLAVDGQVEQGQIAVAMGQLEANGPDFLDPRR